MIFILKIDVLAGGGPIAQNAEAGGMEPGGGRSNASMTLKIALFAPIPMARESTTITTVRPRFFQSMRQA
jgi:hypothetical protein